MNAKFRILLTCLCCVCMFTARAQEGIDYTDAAAFPVFGKAYQDDGPRYRRLPESLHGVIRDAVWDLGTNSSGLYVRFRTDAPEIYARWTNTGNHMPHMTDCGTGGLDLYAHIDGEWKYVGSGFNWGAIRQDHQRCLVNHMAPEMREYMLNLSLYDEVKSLELGVPEGFTLLQPELDSPRSEAPIVMYGTSILQGGCASRPGMAHTNILARRFNRMVINLGFSGNAFLDLEIAELMAQVQHPAVYVMDNVPNSSPDMIRQRGEAFYRILRNAHPDVPVIFVEDPLFSHGVVDQKIAQEVEEKNRAEKELFQKLVDKGEKNIYYLPCEGMTGTDGEAFVDGIHLTDLGMLRYANHITPLLRKCLKENGNLAPEFLKPGDKIALISPSYYVSPDKVKKGAEVVRSWGFEPVIGPNVGKSEGGQYAGTLEERIQDLWWALEDPDIKAILCNRGGYGTLQLMDEFTAQSFRQFPKWIIGFSDITGLLAMENCAGVMGIHAQMAKQVGEQPNELSSLMLRDLLMGKLPDYKLPPHPQNIQGHAEGMLVGGNLCTLTPLLGTWADVTNAPANTPLILFIEEVGESMHNIDRQFLMLRNAGLMDRCAGVILGEFTGCDSEFTYGSVEAMLRPYLEKYGIPVLCGFPAGHDKVNLPLVMGATVVMDVKQDGSSLKFQL